jgi:hypothetical protein
MDDLPGSGGGARGTQGSLPGGPAGEDSSARWASPCTLRSERLSHHHIYQIKSQTKNNKIRFQKGLPLIRSNNIDILGIYAVFF